VDEAIAERFRSENARLRKRIKELEAKLEAKEKETIPPSDTIFVTNYPIVDEYCDGGKPIAGGGL